MFYTVSSNRSSDPRDCNYYNYEEVRRYIAVDRCRNRTERLKFVAQVQDTFAPIVNTFAGSVRSDMPQESNA